MLVFEGASARFEFGVLLLTFAQTASFSSLRGMWAR